MRKAAGIAVTVSIVSVLMLVGAGGAGAKSHARARTRAAGANGLGALIPTHKGQVLPLHGGTTDSLNWSGYAVTPSADNVTAVSSTFTVPSAGLVPPGFAATWTGIGGLRHQRPDPGRHRRAVVAQQPAGRRPVLRLVRAAAGERDAADRLHRRRELHRHPG